jgi:hypothetical protein
MKIADVPPPRLAGDHERQETSFHRTAALMCRDLQGDGEPSGGRPRDQ